MKILFTGGGTGGHIFPIVAIVREIKRLAKKEVRFFYIGPRDEMSQIFLSKEGIKIKTIMAGKFRRYFGLMSIVQNFIDIFLKFPIGFFQSFFLVFFSAPDIIFSIGGYGSLPVTLAGFLLKTPVFLQELDIVPGLANRISVKFASEIFVSFPVKEMSYFPVNKMISVGNPIRRELLGGSKETAKKIFNLTGKKATILIFGGSQGAKRLNNLIIRILPEILNEFELIHQCGEKNLREVSSKTNAILTKNKGLEVYYHLFPFLEEKELKQVYAAADLIISRAGSGSVFEIAAVGKPSILIPLPKSAQDHQIKNAYAYAKNGAAIVIEETNLSPLFFLEKLKYVIGQPKELEKMRIAANEFSKPKAAKVIASYILSMK